MLLSDKAIAALCDEKLDKRLISPFISSNLKKRISADDKHPAIPSISFGLSSCGYDVRLATTFKIFSDLHGVTIDPKRFDEKCLVEVEATYDEDTGEHYIIIPPNSYALGHTIETFNIPRDIGVVAVGKSTYARSGISINVTPMEPGFSGQVVIEICNSSRLPCRIYACEGISQFLFFKLDQPCKVSYSDRRGKYQGQEGIQLSKV